MLRSHRALLFEVKRTTLSHNHQTINTMKKNLIVICIAIVFATVGVSESQAQEESRVGLKAGAGLYSTTTSVSFSGFSAEQTSDSKIGLTAGIYLEKPFSELISGQVEALYVQKGGKDDISGSDTDLDVEVVAGGGKLTLSYIDVPALLKIYIPIKSEEVSPFIYGGGFIGYLLDATATTNEGSIDELDIKDLLKDLNYGLMLGAGVNFGAISLDFRYDLGLANILDTDSDLFDEFDDEEGVEEFNEILEGIEISASGFSFTVGYVF